MQEAVQASRGKSSAAGCLAVIRVVLVLAVIGALAGGGDDNTDTNNSTAGTENNDPWIRPAAP